MGPTVFWAVTSLLLTLGATSLCGLNAPDCGTVGPTPVFANTEFELGLRVVGGEAAEQGMFPWAASIRYSVGGRRRGLCGGSLVSSRHVITAGHCINIIAADGRVIGDPVSVILGTVDITQPLEAPGQEVDVVDIKRHPDFDILGNGAAINDIAILTLEKDVEFSEDIRPICVFHPDPTQIDNPEKKYRVMGWGATVGAVGNRPAREASDLLQYTTLSAVPRDECEAEWRESIRDFDQLDSQFCATGTKGSSSEGATDSCNGDSGGPLALEAKVDIEGERRSRWFLAGVVSFGTRFCNSGNPGVYTRIASYYTPFLTNNLLDRPDNPLCTGELDSMVTMADGQTYAFLGGSYWRITNYLRITGSGIAPRSISDDWGGLPDNIDAAFTSGLNNRTYIFKGSQYWQFTTFGKVDSGFPRRISETFKNTPNDLDAALYFPLTSSIFFFKGSTYCKFEFGSTLRGNNCSYELTIESDWQDVPNNLDAAMTDEGKTYFFAGGNYYRFDNDNGRVDASADPPYPRKTGAWWFNCP